MEIQSYGAKTLIAKCLAVHSCLPLPISSVTYIPPLNLEATVPSVNPPALLLLSRQCLCTYPNRPLLQALAIGHPVHKTYQDDTLPDVSLQGMVWALGHSTGNAPLTCPSGSATPLLSQSQPQKLKWEPARMRSEKSPGTGRSLA